jgi:hypothetical protein
VTAQPVRQMHVQPFKVRNETREKSASESVWPPEWLRDSCRASESRRLALKKGQQWPPGNIEAGRECLAFALASLVDGCTAPNLPWAAGLEHYSMVHGTGFLPFSSEHGSANSWEAGALFPTNGLFRVWVGAPIVLAICSVFVYSPVVFWIEARFARSPSREVA